MSKRVIIATFLIIIFFLILSFLKKGLTKPEKDLEIFTNPQGIPALATGNCNTNSDCFPSGCSSQVCANHEVVTTCEVVDFPEKETYSCGCADNRCVWYR